MRKLAETSPCNQKFIDAITGSERTADVSITENECELSEENSIEKYEATFNQCVSIKQMPELKTPAFGKSIPLGYES